MSTAIAPIVWYFKGSGLSDEVIATTILSYALPFSAELELFVEADLLHPPYDIAAWFEDGISPETQLNRIQASITNNDCCCDAGMLLRVTFVSI